MLTTSFNLITTHFSPSNPLLIFQSKLSQYPQPFVQKIYLSFIQINQIIKQKSHEEIIKRINITNVNTTTNIKNMEKIVLGFVYGVMYYSKNDKNNAKSYEKQYKINESIANLPQKQHNSTLLTKFLHYFSTFRAQTFKLFNFITLQLIYSYFYKILPEYRFGIILLFIEMQKYSICNDELFIAIIKTINVYDEKYMSRRYTLEIMKELAQIIGEQSQLIRQKDPIHIHSSISKPKQLQQLTLMRYYLFPKLMHFYYRTYETLEKSKPLKQNPSCYNHFYYNPNNQQQNYLNPIKNNVYCFVVNMKLSVLEQNQKKFIKIDSFRIIMKIKQKRIRNLQKFQIKY